MNTQTDMKKKDILELIKVTTLQPEQVDALIPAMVQQSMISHKIGESINSLVGVAKHRVFSDEFLGKFVSSFDSIFTHEEIKKLISFYKSDEMRKFFQSYSQTCASIYPAMNQLIDEVVASTVTLKQESNENQVLVISGENFQKEIIECEQPIVLDVYSPMCGPCKAIDPILSELSNQWKGKVEFKKLNIDKEQAISQKLGICSVPTLLFFRKGKIVYQHIGSIHKEELDNKIKAAFQ